MAYIMYQNFEELKDAHPKLAKELVKEVKKDGWEDENLIWFETLADFARYELEEGEYAYESGEFFTQELFGYPNVIDYINLTSLGEDICEAWETTKYHRFSDDSVISTSYGWWISRLCQKHLKILKSLKKSIQRKQNNYCMM